MLGVAFSPPQWEVWEIYGKCMENVWKRDPLRVMSWRVGPLDWSRWDLPFQPDPCTSVESYDWVKDRHVVRCIRYTQCEHIIMIKYESI